MEPAQRNSRDLNRPWLMQWNIAAARPSICADSKFIVLLKIHTARLMPMMPTFSILEYAKMRFMSVCMKLNRAPQNAEIIDSDNSVNGIQRL